VAEDRDDWEDWLPPGPSPEGGQLWSWRGHRRHQPNADTCPTY